MKTMCKNTLCVALALLLLVLSAVGGGLLCPEAAAYEAPLRLPRTLTGNFALDIYAVAKSQVGYKEDYMHGTVYGEWWTEVTDIGYDCTAADWCSIFVCWCMDNAKVPYGINYNKLAGSVEYLFELCRINGSEIHDATESYTPKCGDLAFYSYDGGETLGHIAITDGSDHYIHANYADTVVLREGNSVYRLLDKKYYYPTYYVSPNYEANYKPSGKIAAEVLLFTAAVRFTPAALEQMLRERYEDTGDPVEPYVPKPPVEEKIPGDVDRDGSITAADARMALRASVNLEQLSAIAAGLADVDKNGAVDASDARLILRASVNLETLPES